MAWAACVPTNKIHVNLPGPKAIPPRLGDPILVPHQLPLGDSETTMVDDVPSGTMCRTLADLLLMADRFEAVSTIGAALNGKMITVDDLPGLVESIAGRRGVIRAREWINQDGPSNTEAS
ncbi:hypothetical protein [Allorhizocola rhizosphaerae]|uniref:hypothetical protein n=1 Tax=Allorhizocola rhizosphaerae TaxID=1872709 RepID=UPI000E3B66DA|nr:hypothetical protein [Allorhizocola rhizosphaerae]